MKTAFQVGGNVLMTPMPFPHTSPRTHFSLNVRGGSKQRRKLKVIKLNQQGVGGVRSGQKKQVFNNCVEIFFTKGKGGKGMIGKP